MSLEIEAIYLDGVLKPSEQLPFHPGQKLFVKISPSGNAVERFCGSLRWDRDPEELHRYLADPDESSWSSDDV